MLLVLILLIAPALSRAETTKGECSEVCHNSVFYYELSMLRCCIFFKKKFNTASQIIELRELDLQAL